MKLVVLTNHGETIELFRSVTSARGWLSDHIIKGELFREEINSVEKGSMRLTFLTSAAKYTFWLYEKEIHDNG